jgi:hypothetical protein
MMRDQLHEMSELEKLYKMLNINVNNTDTKDVDDTFKPSIAYTKHEPIHMDHHDKDASKINLAKMDGNEKHTPIKHRVRFGHDESKIKMIAYSDIYHRIKNNYADEDDAQLVMISTAAAAEDADGDGDFPHWSKLTHLYIGSLTVIGLYALFRALQKTR